MNIYIPYGDVKPGKYLKFIPKNPAKNDKGINIAENIAKVVITLFILWLKFDICVSWILDNSSL